MISETFKFSIIVPVYNEDKTILKVLENLNNLKKYYQNIQIIVINDASTDNTENVLKPYLENIRYMANPVNLGLAGTLNTGIKNSKSQFIVRVDADDWVHQDYLHILRLHLNLNLDMDAIACDYKLVDSKQKVINICNCEKEPIGCGIMFRYENLIKIGLYDESFRAREEEDLRIRFLKKYNIERVQLPLYYYRQHDKNKTKDVEEMEKYLKELNDKHG